METKTIESISPQAAGRDISLNRSDLEERRALVKAVRAINATESFGENYEITFILDRESNRPLLRIIDRQTGEVIRQLPPEDTVRLAEEIGRQNSSQS